MFKRYYFIAAEVHVKDEGIKNKHLRMTYSISIFQDPTVCFKEAEKQLGDFADEEFGADSWESIQIKAFNRV